MFKTPVLFIVFKRPSTTQVVFNVIREMQPAKLFVFADGPRTEADLSLCNQTRSIIEQVDWKCEVKTIFSDKNLGGGIGPKTAIDWFFEHVEEGIILEDDVLPSRDFFIFSETLLDRYRDNEKVMHISAMNFHRGRSFTSDSYYFSRVISPWGWATWKRAWQKYDYFLSDLEVTLPQLDILPYYKSELQSVKNGNIITWDYQWLYAVLKNNGVGIVPAKNLALNIGFDSDATRTMNAPDWVKDIIIEPLEITQHPKVILVNKEADDYTFNKVIPPSSNPGFLSKFNKWLLTFYKNV